jgi:hypothetical protein
VVSPAELRACVQRILGAPGSSPSPAKEQLGDIEAWLAELDTRREVTSLLEEPLAPDATWEPMVWRLFHEFASYCQDRAELTIAVIGLD